MYFVLRTVYYILFSTLHDWISNKQIKKLYIFVYSMNDDDDDDDEKLFLLSYINMGQLQ